MMPKQLVTHTKNVDLILEKPNTSRGKMEILWINFFLTGVEGK